MNEAEHDKMSGLTRLAALEVVRAGLREDRAGAVGIIRDHDPTLVCLSLMDMVVLLLRQSTDAEHFLDLLAIHEMGGQPWTDLLGPSD